MKTTKAYFAAEGYELILTYDTVDGLQTIDPGVMQPLWERILAQGYGGGGSTPSSGTSPTPSAAGQPAAAVGRNPPGAFAADAPTAPAAPRRMPTTAGAALQPNQALDVLRTVLSQKQVAAAVIIRYGDKLFGDPQRQSPEELRNLICLKKMVEEEADLPAGHPCETCPVRPITICRGLDPATLADMRSLGTMQRLQAEHPDYRTVETATNG